MKNLFYLIIPLLIFEFAFGFKNHSGISPHTIQIEKAIISDSILPVNPIYFLATLTFDKNETCFPQSFCFNTTQDANKDGKIDAEDNLENLVLYSIGNNISGTGRTGLTLRGPNDQRPAVYFHCDTAGIYQVYEYWFYYADNNWINNHEHDWEKYFVYVKNNLPQFIKLSHHKSFTTYAWKNFPQQDGYPVIGIHRGSHALEEKASEGVEISENGRVTMKKGKLLKGNDETIPWIIYSNDKNIPGVISFPETTKLFYYGDAYYFSDKKENGDARKSPWERVEWNTPPLP
jgi:hypothetical protein